MDWFTGLVLFLFGVIAMRVVSAARRRWVAARIREELERGIIPIDGYAVKAARAHVAAGHPCVWCTGQGLKSQGVPHDAQCPLVKVEVMQWQK